MVESEAQEITGYPLSSSSSSTTASSVALTSGVKLFPVSISTKRKAASIASSTESKTGLFIIRTP